MVLEDAFCFDSALEHHGFFSFLKSMDLEISQDTIDLFDGTEMQIAVDKPGHLIFGWETTILDIIYQAHWDFVLNNPSMLVYVINLEENFAIIESFLNDFPWSDFSSIQKLLQCIRLFPEIRITMSNHMKKSARKDVFYISLEVAMSFYCQRGHLDINHVTDNLLFVLENNTFSSMIIL